MQKKMRILKTFFLWFIDKNEISSFDKKGHCHILPLRDSNDDHAGTDDNGNTIQQMGKLPTIVLGQKR